MMTSPRVNISWNLPIREKAHRVVFQQDVLNYETRIFLDDRKVFEDRDHHFNVGETEFYIGALRCAVVIERNPIARNRFFYKLQVDGRSYLRVKEHFYNNFLVWNVDPKGAASRIVMDKTSLVVWVNEEMVEVDREFTENGTAAKFERNGCQFTIVTESNVSLRSATHKLLIGDEVEASVKPTVNLEECVFEADFELLARCI